jgi:hypothetical protein
MGLITQNPTVDVKPSAGAPALYYLADGAAVFGCVGNPNGVVFANRRSLAIDETGRVYTKSSDNSNTGWAAVGSTNEMSLSQANFGRFNFGSSTATDTSNGLKLVTEVNSGDSLRLLTRPLPGSNWQVTVKFLVPWFNIAGSGAWGIYVRNSTSLRLVFQGCRNNPGNLSESPRLQCSRFLNTGSFNSAINLQDLKAQEFPVWLRMESTVSTLTFTYSDDGSQFFTFGITEPYASWLTAAGGSVDEIGVAGNSSNVTTNQSIFIQGYVETAL